MSDSSRLGEACFDPFDLWAVPFLGRIKSRWYEGSFSAKLALFGLYALDLLAPVTLRHLLKVSKHEFAHSHALLRNTEHALTTDEFLRRIEKLTSGDAWGLPFAWYSKNGIYPAGLPLVTAAPYVFSALLDIPNNDAQKFRAMALFHDSWHFLNSLQIHIDTDDQFALSYAPFDDSFTVINANSYAAWSYAMHARFGQGDRREKAKDNARRLVNWVINQQNEDGSWFYLAQRGDWDMIDGFHSCFVVRNLKAVAQLMPELSGIIDPAIGRGWAYIRTHIYDDTAGLCRRYAQRHRPDPFRYDIYDQAEYLGLLLDFGAIDEARRFANVVISKFKKRQDWYCRIDMFGRLWGKNFNRWGIVPFVHHLSRLDEIENQGAASCAD